MDQKEYDPRPDLAYSRTHLSNQRTYAAWLRTGLSAGAVGLVIAHLVPQDSADRELALGLGLMFVAVGAVVIAFGAWSFRRIGKTLAEAGTPPPAFTACVVYASAFALTLLLLAALLLM